MGSLEISIVSYERPNLIRCLLWSLASQTCKDFKVSVYHDGPSDATKEIVGDFKKQIVDFEVNYFESDLRFNDFGHSLREMALNNCGTSLMLLTNDDNYYVPTMVENILSQDWENTDIVYFDMVHNHIIPSLPNPIGYQTLITEPRATRIDMGSFVFRTCLGKEVGFTDKSYGADGYFFEAMRDRGARIAKIRKVLFVHN